MTRTVALLVILAAAGLAAQRQEPAPLRAAKLVMPASAAAPPTSRRTVVPPPLSALESRRLALGAGMPVTYSLSGTPVSLSARRTYIDGVAHLSSIGLSFDAGPDHTHLRLGDERSVMINFRTQAGQALVLIAIHGVKTFGGTAQAKLVAYPPGGTSEPVVATTAVGPLIPFAVTCNEAGWQKVVFVIEGAQVGYEVARIDVSVFS